MVYGRKPVSNWYDKSLSAVGWVLADRYFIIQSNLEYWYGKYGALDNQVFGWERLRAEPEAPIAMHRYHTICTNKEC